MKTERFSNRREETGSSQGRARWMVVDDDEGVRDFIACMLEYSGVAQVEQFGCARDALTAFEARPEQFQLVITDLEMPGMNGIELCRRLRAIDPGLKVVLATGSGFANEAGARKSGFRGFLNKPFPPEDICRIVEAVGAHPKSAHPASL